MALGTRSLLLSSLLLLALLLGPQARAPRLPAPERVDPMAALRSAACGSATLADVASRSGATPCAAAPAPPLVSAIDRAGRDSFQRVGLLGDGMLVGRQRILAIDGVALDLVAYQSSGLIIGGLLCYTDDGQPRSTVLHLHSGMGGIFVNPNPPGVDTISSCYDWAAHQGRNVFVPSYRGQDGGQGEPELCLGEADDVANAATMLRGLDVVDPNRLAVIGGSLGGCVALKAGVMIPNLRAVVAIAPPTDWAAMIDFHRHRYAPAVETRCDGSRREFDDGGPAFADVLDAMICRRRGCTVAEYQARSPIPLVYEATNPTLVVAASADNHVPAAQQLLWSGLRNDRTRAVAVEVRSRCSAMAAPPFAQDALIYVPGAFHLIENGPVASALLWMFERLDESQAPSSDRL